MDLIISLLPLLGLGLLLGLQHAAEPDHIAAVATLTTRTTSLRSASRLGAWWGLGHTSMLLVVGLLVLGFRLTIPERFTLSLEFIVGIMVVVLGVRLLQRLTHGHLHSHTHHHGDETHTHLHSHQEDQTHAHHHVSFLTGLIHGLAGSGVLVLLVLSTAGSLTQGILFILIFGLGSILGMTLASSLFVLPLFLFGRSLQIQKTTMMTAGAMSVTIGMRVVYLAGTALWG